MIFDIHLTWIQACLLASLYPFFLWLTLQISASFLKYLLTGLLLCAAVYLESRGMLVAVLLVFLFFQQTIFKAWKKRTIIITASCLVCAIFILKFNSSVGRVFIWTTILRNVQQVPLTGSGADNFKETYAGWQSAYFTENQDWDRFHYVADAPSFAYNELLQLYMEYGLAILPLFIAVLFINLKLLWQHKTSLVTYCAASNLVIFFFSLFYYPFHIAWILSLFVFNHLMMAVLLYGKGFIAGQAALIFLLSFYFVKYQRGIQAWQTAEGIPFNAGADKAQYYRNALMHLPDDPYLLHEYGNFLLDTGKPDTAIALATTNKRYFNQYECGILLGKAFFQKNDHRQALRYFENAHRLVPNRFLPLYYQMQTALQMKDSTGAIDNARKIMQMPVKIPSGTVDNIKREAGALVLK